MTIEQKPKRQWLMPLLCALLLSFTVCVYAPLETYYSTASKLWFTPDMLWLPILLSFLACLLVLTGIGLIFRRMLRSVWCALLIGISIALYVQAGFLNMNYGLLDGTQILWDSYGEQALWNMAIWLLLLVLPLALTLWKKLHSISILRFVSVLLLLTQMTSLVAIGATTAPKKTEKYGFVSGEEYDLSSKSNIVVFVLDMFDTTSFGDLLACEPNLKTDLDGFTWFSRSVGMYPVTWLGLPNLLLGMTNRLEKGSADVAKEAWNDNEFFRVLKAEGFDTRVYAASTYACEEALGLVDNIAKQSVQPVSISLLWQKMMKLTGFRFLPHVMKKDLVIATEEIDNLKAGTKIPVYTLDDEANLKMFRSKGLNATLDVPAFRFYHWRGAHVPYLLRSDETIGQTPVPFHEQIGTVMNAVVDYLNEMKALGIYEDATVVITADHGSTRLDPAALLLIKRPNERGTLKENRSLVSPTDLQKTIATAAGLSGTVSLGEDAFKIDLMQGRKVPYFVLHKPDVDHLYEYTVSLDNENLLNYQYTNVFYVTGHKYIGEIPNCKLGEWQNCAKLEDAIAWFDPASQYFLTQGKDGVWIGYPDNRLYFALDEAMPGDGVLTLRFSEIVGASQRLQLLCDSELLDEVIIDKDTLEVSLTLAPEVFENHPISLTLRFPDAISEYELNGWVDGDPVKLAAVLNAWKLQ